MAALVPRYARHGRLKHQFGAPPIPTIWVEIGTETLPDPDHEIWSLPNTYPYLSLDMRFGRYSDGTTEDFTSSDITPESLANLIQQMTEDYIDVFAPVCKRIGKPLRVAWLIKGLDAGPGDTTLFVTEDPYDCGMPGPKSADGNPMVRPRTVLFHSRARQHIRSWAEECFAEVGDRLTSNELPFPELVVTDIESAPALNQSYRSNPEVFAGFEILGWFEDAEVKAHYIAALEDEYLFDGGQTFVEWKDARTTLLDGSAIEDYDRTALQETPTNFDRCHWAVAAGQMSYIETLRYGLYEPIQNALGAGVKCGEWAMFTDSRDYPINLWPEFFTFWKYGVFGAEVQVPNNYGDRFPYFILNSHTTAEGWPTIQDWKNHRQLNGIDGNDRDLINQAVYSNLTRAAVRSNPNCSLVPSVAVQGIDGIYAYVEEMFPHMLQYMLYASQLGASGFWLFAANFDTDSDIRKWTTELAVQFTRAAQARRTPRNRVRRYSRA